MHAEAMGSMTRSLPDGVDQAFLADIDRNVIYVASLMLDDNMDKQVLVGRNREGFFSDEEAVLGHGGPKGQRCAAEWHGSACSRLYATTMHGVLGHRDAQGMK
jgi:hypothetical protein